MAKPIRPEEVTEAKARALPDYVTDSFNELIVEKMSLVSARITQEDVIKRIAYKAGISVSAAAGMAFENHWLDVEDVYRQAGWHVEYDKPGFNESYKAFFVFSRQKPKR